jgi:glycogen operon protein
MARIVGSPDLLPPPDHGPFDSINYVTCHDGFTLADLVAYDRKHNEANGEDNRDGTDHNMSWNCGAEGPVDDPEIEGLRNTQVKNFLALTLLAYGAPMLLMGDEMRRTQRGNNNAYCQDSEISWLDWSLLEKHADIHRFVKLLIAFRQGGRAAAESSRFTLNQLLRQAPIRWHGVALDCPDLSEDSHSMALTGLRGGFLVHAMFNAYWEPLAFELPPLRKRSHESWRRWIDTSLASPHDIRPWEEAPLVSGTTYLVQPRSMALLITRPAQAPGPQRRATKAGA